MKIQHTMLTAAALAAFTAGCSTPKSAIHTPPPPPTHPVTVMHDIPIESQANVRMGEVVKAYPINRYVDPANRNIMHERHVIYRVEQQPGWRLSSNARKQVLVGPTVSDGSLDRSPALSKELQAELERQKRATAEVSQRADELNKKMVVLGDVKTALEGIAEHQRSQAESLAELKRRAAALKANGPKPLTPEASAPPPVPPTDSNGHFAP